MSRKPAVPGVDRRQQILESALSIFAERGFEAATNKEIAEQAGVNQGLIYFYFASKADVYFATFAYHTEQVLTQFDAIFAQVRNTDPVDGLKGLLKQIMLILSASPATQLLRIMYQNAVSRTPPGELSNQEDRQAVFGIARHLSLRLREYLASQMSHGRFRTLDLGTLSNLMTRTMLVTSGIGARDGRAQLDLEALAEMMADVYCYGLLPREAPNIPE